MDENKEITTEIPVEKVTFDDLLKDPDYQREFDKKVAKALEKSKAKWQADADKKRSEAEELARMSEEEKHRFEMDKLTKERDSLAKKLNAYELRNEALKIAKEKGMDVSLLDIINFEKEDAESVKEKIDLIASTVSKATESKINERLKQSPPKNVQSSEKPKKVNRASF